MTWRAAALVGGAAGLVLLGGLTSWPRAPAQTPLTTDQVLALLQQRRPTDYNEAWWTRLVATVGETLRAEGVETLSAHHADMIARTLELHAAEALPCEEKVAYEVEAIKWGLPRFLSDPPTERETELLLGQIDDLAGWMETRVRAHLRGEPLSSDAQAQLERSRVHCREMATSFRHRTALHPVAQSDIEAAKAAFDEWYARELARPQPGDPEEWAAGMAFGELTKRAARPPFEPLPENVKRAQDAMVASIGREMDKRIAAHEQTFRSTVMRDQLSGKREDLEAWSLMLDAAEVQRIAGGGREWACCFEVEVGTRAVVAVWAEETESGSVILRTPRVADPSPSKWRWENRDLEVDAERLYVREAPVGGQLWVPLEAPPPMELVHFAEQDWAKALAAQATASLQFWQALGAYVRRADGDADKTGATDLAAGIGVLPFLATPAVQRFERAKAGDAVRLLSAEGQEVGTVRCEYGFREAALKGTPSQITLELGPRTLMGGVTMRVKHGTEQAPTEERWSAPIPAGVRKVVFHLTASPPAAALESIVASDEKDQVLCTIGVSDLAFD